MAAGFRGAVAADRGQLAALWKAVFGDSEETAAHLLDAFAGEGNVFVAEEGGAVLAQLLAVPCGAGALDGRYFYALATRPDCRGRGLMSGLMRHSEEAVQKRGAAFALLNPASDSLFGFYGQRGYETVEMRLLTREVVPAACDDITFGRLAAEDFLDLRRDVFADIYPEVAPVVFTPARTALILEDLWAEGYLAARSGTGYALFRDGEVPFVAEVAAPQSEAGRLLAAIACRTGKTRLNLTLPAPSKVFPGEGRLFGEAQVKWLAPEAAEAGISSPQEKTSLYLRFAMDEAHKRLAGRGLL